MSVADPTPTTSPNTTLFHSNTTTINHLVYEQDQDILKPWIDSHQLKNVYRMWYKGSRRVVTGRTHHKWTIIKAHHDPPIYGHPAITRTLQLMAWQYWWPKMSQDVTEYVKDCVECQWNKINTRPIHTPLQPIYAKPKALPFETIALDFITKLPESEGSNSIIVMTRWVIFLDLSLFSSSAECEVLMLVRSYLRYKTRVLTYTSQWRLVLFWSSNGRR